MKDSELSPMEVFIRGGVAPSSDVQFTMLEYLDLAYKAELARQDEAEHERLMRSIEPKPQAKKQRPDFHGLRLIRGGRRD
jgi:hypothetical protein